MLSPSQIALGLSMDDPLHLWCKLQNDQHVVHAALGLAFVPAGLHTDPLIRYRTIDLEAGWLHKFT